MPDLQAHSPAMGQEDGKKWTAAVDSQPTFHKSDRLPGTLIYAGQLQRRQAAGGVAHVPAHRPRPCADKDNFSAQGNKTRTPAIRERTPYDDDGMPAEIDFSGARRGQFCRAGSQLNLPVYRDQKVQAQRCAAHSRSHYGFNGIVQYGLGRCLSRPICS